MCLSLISGETVGYSNGWIWHLHKGGCCNSRSLSCKMHSALQWVLKDFTHEVVATTFLKVWACVLFYCGLAKLTSNSDSGTLQCIWMAKLVGMYITYVSGYLGYWLYPSSTQGFNLCCRRELGSCFTIQALQQGHWPCINYPRVDSQRAQQSNVSSSKALSYWLVVTNITLHMFALARLIMVVRFDSASGMCGLLNYQPS